MEEELEYYKIQLSDLIPYDDPKYEEKLTAMARSCMNSFNDPDFQKLCEYHDRMLEEGDIEH